MSLNIFNYGNDDGVWVLGFEFRVNMGRTRLRYDEVEKIVVTLSSRLCCDP